MGKLFLNNKMFARVVIRRSFALDNTRTMTRHIQDRVVSTGQWPVPFYQRHYKPMTVGQTTREDLSQVGAPIGNSDVENTRNHLNMTANGRQKFCNTLRTIPRLTATSSDKMTLEIWPRPIALP